MWKCSWKREFHPIILPKTRLTGIFHGSEELKQIAETVDVVCFGTMAGADSKSGETLEMFLQHVREGAIRLFDVNLRGDFYSEEQINRLLPYADIVKCNNEELPWLATCAGVPAEAETYASWLASRGIRGFICTREIKTAWFSGEEIKQLFLQNRYV